MAAEIVSDKVGVQVPGQDFSLDAHELTAPTTSRVAVREGNVFPAPKETQPEFDPKLNAEKDQALINNTIESIHQRREEGVELKNAHILINENSSDFAILFDGKIHLGSKNDVFSTEVETDVHGRRKVILGMRGALRGEMRNIHDETPHVTRLGGTGGIPMITLTSFSPDDQKALAA